MVGCVISSQSPPASLNISPQSVPSTPQQTETPSTNSRQLLRPSPLSHRKLRVHSWVWVPKLTLPQALSPLLQVDPPLLHLKLRLLMALVQPTVPSLVMPPLLLLVVFGPSSLASWASFSHKTWRIHPPLLFVHWYPLCTQSLIIRIFASLCKSNREEGHSLLNFYSFPIGVVLYNATWWRSGELQPGRSNRCFAGTRNRYHRHGDWCAE